MSVEYIRAIKDIYEGVKISIRTSGGGIEDFSIDIGLHQGLPVSPFLFIVVIDVLTKRI